jgi:hypothetical protein
MATVNGEGSPTGGDVLYAPYKSIGFVIDSLPFQVNRLGEENFLLASAGCAFQVYRLDS